LTRVAPAAETLLADPGYRPLKQYLIESTGLAYYHDKDQELAEMVGRRLAANGSSTCSTYLSLLRGGEAGDAELDALVADLTVGETTFFRLEEQFEALRRMILPSILRRNAARRQLRIWSAGCATGAEPYSIAILLERELAADLAGWQVSILGTDINRRFLAQAREGEYGDWALRTTDQATREACFQRSGSLWRIRDQYRERVSFQYHDLARHPFPSLVHNLAGFDLILCRNVLIYFGRDAIQGCLGRLWASLVDGGWLLVGHAEMNVDLFRAFRTVSFPGTSLFERTASIPRKEGNTPPPVWLPARTPDPPPPARTPTPAPLVVTPTSLLVARIRDLADRARWDEAAEVCRGLIEQDGLDPLGHFLQSLVAEQLGQRQEAESALDRALHLDRDFVLAHYHRGLLLQKGRDLAGAARSFRNVVDLLASRPPETRLPEADGLSAGDLRELAQMQLEVLGPG
jgi:chemotaxis protein methyltransferase CheR